MKPLAFIASVFGFVFFANLAYADDMTIEMLNKREDGAKMVYSEDIARIDVGDTITWGQTLKRPQCRIRSLTVGIFQRKVKTTKKLQLHLTYQVCMYISVHHKAMGMIGLVVVAEGGEVPLNDVSKTKVMGKSKKKLKALLGDLHKIIQKMNWTL